MALDFLSRAATEDAELFIKLDLDGLHSLLQIVGSAMEAAQAGAQTIPALEAQEAGGEVTVTNVVPTRGAPADRRPN